MIDPVDSYIGLGSNLAGELASPQAQLLRALDELATLPDTELFAYSPLYRSPPMGPQDQPDYLNAVACIRTRLQAEALLDALQDIELAHDRLREQHWGPRTLDLDILLYGNEQIRSKRLVLPHPGIGERAFVLYPLRDIAPDLEIPGVGVVAELADSVAADGVEALSDQADQAEEQGTDSGKTDSE